MAEQRHLRNAPITEMLFDLRLAAPVDLTDEHFKALGETSVAQYPRTELKQRIEGTIKFNAGRLSAETRPLGAKGLFATSSDGLTVAQFRPDGFTLNRLRPYTSWDDLFPEALRLWNLYSAVSGGTAVGRVGLRFINHLDLPLQEGDEFSSYFTMPPDLPEPVPQSVSAFVMQFTAHDTSTAIGANITQALAAPLPSPKVVLDIDVFKVLVPPVRDETEIRNIFAALHEMKNRVFFGLVTERCLQLFQ